MNAYQKNSQSSCNRILISNLNIIYARISFKQLSTCYFLFLWYTPLNIKHLTYVLSEYLQHSPAQHYFSQQQGIKHKDQSSGVLKCLLKRFIMSKPLVHYPMHTSDYMQIGWEDICLSVPRAFQISKLWVWGKKKNPINSCLIFKCISHTLVSTRGEHLFKIQMYASLSAQYWLVVGTLAEHNVWVECNFGRHDWTVMERTISVSLPLYKPLAAEC